jgi:predicted aminopeptidase
VFSEGPSSSRATSTLGYERDPASPTMLRTDEELGAKKQILGIRL